MSQKLVKYIVSGVYMIVVLAFIGFLILMAIGYRDTKRENGTCGCAFNQTENKDQWSCIYQSDYLKYPAPEECPDKIKNK